MTTRSSRSRHVRAAALLSVAFAVMVVGLWAHAAMIVVLGILIASVATSLVDPSRRRAGPPVPPRAATTRELEWRRMGRAHHEH